jgi:hypothetical protein
MFVQFVFCIIIEIIIVERYPYTDVHLHIDINICLRFSKLMNYFAGVESCVFKKEDKKKTAGI